MAAIAGALLCGPFLDAAAKGHDAAEQAATDPCSNGAWDTQGAMPSEQAVWRSLAACAARLEQDPADERLVAVVSRIRIKLGLLDAATQALVDQAFSAGDPAPMTTEIEALVTRGQEAKAEPLIRRVAA